MPPTPDEIPVSDIEQLFRNLKPQSRAAVELAKTLLRAPGVAATLIIEIKPDPNQPTECFLSTAPSKLVSELWRTRSSRNDR